MRYSITFLGLIAITSGTPITTSTTDPCQSLVQRLLTPLAKDPAAAKFCAAKYLDSSAATTSTANIKSNNPLYVQLNKAADKVASTFCTCNFDPCARGSTSNSRGRGCGRGGTQVRGRIRRYRSEDSDEA
ncbi:hypothetical protein ACN47E_000921 [Coniothyrium glycines]